MSKSSDGGQSHDAFDYNFIDEYRTEFCLVRKGRVVIHDPNEVPTVKRDYQKSTTFYNDIDFTEIKIVPKITTAEESLRDVDLCW